MDELSELIAQVESPPGYFTVLPKDRGPVIAKYLRELQSLREDVATWKRRYDEITATSLEAKRRQDAEIKSLRQENERLQQGAHSKQTHNELVEQIASLVDRFGADGETIRDQFLGE